MKQSGHRDIGRSVDPKNSAPGTNGWKMIRAVIREIFDEAAYDRFLQRTKACSSVESYRAFMREREAATAQKPRCC